MTKEEREARRKVEECKGSYDMNYFCDFCPLSYIIPHYDEETGEEWEEFRCTRIRDWK